MLDRRLRDAATAAGPPNFQLSQAGRNLGFNRILSAETRAQKSELGPGIDYIMASTE